MFLGGGGLPSWKRSDGEAGGPGRALPVAGAAEPEQQRDLLI